MKCINCKKEIIEFNEWIGNIHDLNFCSQDCCDNFYDEDEEYELDFWDLYITGVL